MWNINQNQPYNPYPHQTQNQSPQQGYQNYGQPQYGQQRYQPNQQNQPRSEEFNVNYPSLPSYQNDPKLASQSRIPLNPGIALLGLVGQNTINKNRASYQTYDYSAPNPSFSRNKFNQPYTTQFQAPPARVQPQNLPPTFTDSYKLRTYMLNKLYLDQYIPSIFEKYDFDKNGTIETLEFPGMIAELFRCLNMPPPSQNDTWYLMWKFDRNQDGHIDYYEWADMVYTLGGLKNAD